MANETRDKLYRHHGPKLSEAIALVELDQFNAIRAHVGLPPLENQQVLNALKAKWDSLPDYDWEDK